MRSQAAARQADELVGLLERGFGPPAGVIDAIPPSGFESASPCTGWTVRDVANHLVGALDIFARIVEEHGVDPAEFADGSAAPDLLGTDPPGAYRAAADKCLAAFRGPGVLEEVFPFLPGPAPGFVIANVSLSEALFHGWDMARGAGVPYVPDEAVVDAVARFHSQGNEADLRAEGMFGPAQPTPPDASPFTALLGFAGRRT
ncbi:TIGR03086 family metal-binding protein [Parasphingorhabdus pacifica]